MLLSFSDVIVSQKSYKQDLNGEWKRRTLFANVSVRDEGPKLPEHKGCEKKLNLFLFTV